MADQGELGRLMANYVAARAAFSEADKAADELHDRLSAAVDGVAHSRSHGRISGHVRTFDPAITQEWVGNLPIAADILAVASRWREARAIVKAAYAALPEDVRSHVQPLPNGAHR